MSVLITVELYFRFSHTHLKEMSVKRGAAITLPVHPLLPSSFYLSGAWESLTSHLYFYLFIYFLLFQGRTQVRLEVQLELQLLAYATATQGPSCVCYLHHSSLQCQILNPLRKSGDRTRNLMVSSQIRFCCTTMGAPIFTFSSLAWWTWRDAWGPPTPGRWESFMGSGTANSKKWGILTWSKPFRNLLGVFPSHEETPEHIIWKKECKLGCGVCLI